MTPHYADDWLTIYAGDCRAVLATLPDESVHCVVTSPPYWGLRDYGTASWVGGDEGCPHRVPATGSTMNKGNNNHEGKPFPSVCGVCGATRIDNQLGLEPTPEQYVENMVAVFREVRRVLRDDGTLWLNLGDSYAANRGSGASSVGDKQATNVGSLLGSLRVPGGLKEKDLVGIPWRVAFALQADGWYLRSDIIWSKPNPMPESVSDRPTKSHEMIFLFSKSARYFFDADAVREGIAQAGVIQGSNGHRQSLVFGQDFGLESASATTSLVGISLATTVLDLAQSQHDLGRNIRSVWTIPTRPYAGAHFAVFPPEIPERCINAGCPELGTVLDPFAGSGTTGMVAQRLSRRAVLIDLNPEYLEQQLVRNADVPLGLSA